jgi:hypothetical protein
MRQKGGVLPVILLILLAVSAIVTGYFAIQNKTFFRPQAAIVAGQKTAIHQNLGLKICLDLGRKPRSLSNKFWKIKRQKLSQILQKQPS